MNLVLIEIDFFFMRSISLWFRHFNCPLNQMMVNIDNLIFHFIKMSTLWKKGITLSSQNRIILIFTKFGWNWFWGILIDGTLMNISLRVFQSYRNVTITSEGLQNLGTPSVKLYISFHRHNWKIIPLWCLLQQSRHNQDIF